MKNWQIRERANLGGQGSGNRGHAGRPGQVGGSVSRVTFANIPPNNMDVGYIGQDRSDGISQLMEWDTLAAEVYAVPYQEHTASANPMTWRSMSGPYQTEKTKQFAQDLADKYNLNAEQVEETMRAWTAGPWNPNSVEIQKAVSDEFGVPMTPYNEKAYKEMPRETMVKHSDIEGTDLTIHPIEQKDARKIVRAMYAETQEYLEQFKTPMPDGDRLKLYRGVTLSKETQGESLLVQVRTSPVSSWAVNSLVARQFAEANWPDGAVIISDIPFKRIFSMPHTGIGSISEGEIMVIGGTNDAAEILTRMD